MTGFLTNMLTIIFAWVLWEIVMLFQSLPEFKSFEGAAGLYAFLFLVLKEIIQFALKFKKDATQTQLETISATMVKQSNTMVEQSNHMGDFVNAIKETERERIGLIRQFSDRLEQSNKGVHEILSHVKRKRKV